MGLRLHRLPEVPETSGNAFLRVCSALDRAVLDGTETVETFQNIANCVGYIHGFIKGITVEQVFVEGYTHQKEVPVPFCLPDKVENGQIVRIVLKYIRDNPAVANQPTSVLIMKALGKSYPCPSK